MFEGKYLEGFRREGKLYINGNLRYEGEYALNIKWHGKGYDENGNVIYILKRGNGNIKEYYYKDVLKFEGEYSNGVRNGKYKEYFGANELKFEGEYLNGEKMVKEKNITTLLF